MLPITGPFSEEKYLNGPPTSSGFKPRIYENYRLWLRQQPPYNLPLDYKSWTRRVLSYHAENRSGNQDPDYYETVSFLPTEIEMDQVLYARAYSDFKEKVGEYAQLGIAAAEGAKSVSMLTERLAQMWRFTRFVSTGKFGKAAAELGVVLARKASDRMSSRYMRYRAKSFANNYLEFHFGWKPVLMDIHKAMEALSQPIHGKQVEVRRTRHIDVGSRSSRTNYGSFTVKQHLTAKAVQTISLRANVHVENPNRARMEQLGLVNPATIVLEKIPFSFLVEHFVNINQWLESFTDFSGLSFTNQNRTIFTRYKQELVENTDYLPDSFYPVPTTSSREYAGVSVMTNRVVGPFPGPQLIIRPLRALSWERGLAYASLLAQRLRHAGPDAKRFNR